MTKLQLTIREIEGFGANAISELGFGLFSLRDDVDFLYEQRDAELEAIATERALHEEAAEYEYDS